ncbi:MAG: PQQ-dependent sugar dehydrogenase [Aureliella sp.]
MLAVSSLFLITADTVRAETGVNQLTRPETLSGWQLLFDGKSLDAWRNYQKEGISDGWKIVDGALVRDGDKPGDLITKEKYQYFELSLEYNISEAGNSGLMFHVTEDQPQPYNTGPEVQIQDNQAGRDPQKSGWLYQLVKPNERNGSVVDVTRPAGQWNQLFLRIAPNQCLVLMNGQTYYSFKLGDKQWNEAVANSKFATMPGFGAAGEGYICLQDHGDRVAFRNIKVRKLDVDGSVQQPIDGKLNMHGELAFPQLKFSGWDPVDDSGKVRKQRLLELTYAPDAPQRLYAIDQIGTVYTFENRPDATEANLLLDIQEKVSQWSDSGANNEQGLLGLAMHPKFTENGLFFVCYTRRDDGTSVVSRYQVRKDNPLEADPESEVILLELKQPFQNHNGGSIEFGPDGMLYIAFGDGGLANDPLDTAQDRSKWLGSILRIDVDGQQGGKHYSIPADNPFVNTDAMRPEIYAYGLRNPWRIAFDKTTGRLWAGDVGQELWEEVDIIEKGGNYGWSVREGSHPFGNRPNREDVSTPIAPVWEYDHDIGKSITGGRVYRSQHIPELAGKYIYADYVSGAIWALTYDDQSGKVTKNEQVIAGGIPVLAFGQDASGEVYYMIDSANGECIYRFAKGNRP